MSKIYYNKVVLLLTISIKKFKKLKTNKKKIKKIKKYIYIYVKVVLHNLIKKVKNITENKVYLYRKSYFFY